MTSTHAPDTASAWPTHSPDFLGDLGGDAAAPAEHAATCEALLSRLPPKPDRDAARQSPADAVFGKSQLRLSCGYLEPEQIEGGVRRPAALLTEGCSS
ncbi:hypothetical protein ABTZ59_03040 [Streptomyces sp. NPDC094034]|uniref:hypothetical protein n=1 Tax=Streptomyces sp. NPDC094034 TaxID=3155309 RepID=UPI0033174CBA